MKFFLLVLFLIPLGGFSQERTESICYPRYAVSDDRLNKLLGKELDEISDCLNDSVVLSFTVYLSRYEYSARVDTGLALEIAPFFTWNDVGKNYQGVTYIDGTRVFIRENEEQLWINKFDTLDCFDQRVIGDFETEMDEGSKELPNSIYQSIQCYFQLDDGNFVRKGKDCSCRQ